jgi:hypothetical protein
MSARSGDLVDFLVIAILILILDLAIVVDFDIVIDLDIVTILRITCFDLDLDLSFDLVRIGPCLELRDAVLDKGKSTQGVLVVGEHHRQLVCIGFQSPASNVASLTQARKRERDVGVDGGLGVSDIVALSDLKGSSIS